MRNRNCCLRLLQRSGEQCTSRRSEATYVGMEHIALETADILAALDYCKERNLTLDTDNGKPYYNPKVWGTGMYYFNILTDFGVKVEISQRLDRPAPSAGPLICGLEHFGIQVASMETSLPYYLNLGFEQKYPTVKILKKDLVLCAMIGVGDFIAELFEFTDAGNYIPFQNEPIYGLTLTGDQGVLIGPNGERFQTA